MKILKIDEKKGLFINPCVLGESGGINEKYKDIKTITKEDILSIIDFTIENDIEMDEYDESLLLNPADRVIYENLYNHLLQLKDSRDDLIKQIDDKFKEAEEKYLN